MAGETTDIRLTLTVADQYSQPMVGFQRSLYFTGAALLAMNYRLDDLIEPFRELNRLILKSTIVVGGLSAAVGYFATTAAAQFEESIANIGTLVHGLADDAIPGLTNKILTLSTELPKKVNDLAEAFYFVQSAMPGNIDNFEILEQAAKGATIGLSDTLTVADALTTVMNAFGKTTKEEATVALNEMFGSVVQGKITMTTLAQNIGTVAAAAADSGLQIREMLGAYSLVTRITGQASRSATGLRGALISLAKPSLRAQAAFNRNGIAIRDLSGNMRNLIDIIGDISNKQLAYNEIAQMFPRARTINTVLALINNYDMLKNIIEDVGSSTELAGEAIGEILDILKSKIEITTNLIEILGITLGEEFARQIKPAIDALNNFLKVILDWGKDTEISAKIAEEALGGLVNAIDGVFTTLADKWEEIIGEVDFGYLATSFDKFKKSVSDLLNLDYDSLEGLSGVIQVLVDSVGFFFDVLSGYVRGWDEFIITPAKAAVSGINLLVTILGKLTGIKIEKTAIAQFVGGLAALATPLSLLFKLLSKIISVVVVLLGAKYLVALTGAFGGALTGALGKTITAFSSLFLALFSIKGLLIAVGTIAAIWLTGKLYDLELATKSTGEELLRLTNPIAEIIIGFKELGESVSQFYEDTNELKDFLSGGKEALKKGWLWGIVGIFQEAQKISIKRVLDKQQENLSKHIDAINEKYGTHFEKTKEGYKEAGRFLANYGDAIGEHYSKIGKTLSSSTREQEESFISLQENLKQVEKHINETSQALDRIRLGFRFGIIDTAREAAEELAQTRRELGAFTEELRGIDFVGEALFNLLDSLRAINDTSTTLQSVGQGIFKLGEFSGTSVLLVERLRDELMLAGVSSSVANVTAQMSVLGGHIKESSEKAKMFMQIKEFIRMGLLEPTEEVNKALGELQQGMTKLDFIGSLVGPVEDAAGNITSLKSRIQGLMRIFPQLSGEMKTNVKQGIAALIEEFRNLQIQMGNTESEGESLLDLLNELTGVTDFATEFGIDYQNALWGLERAFSDVARELPRQANQYGEVTAALESGGSAAQAFQEILSKQRPAAELDAALRQLSDAAGVVFDSYSKFGGESDEVNESIKAGRDALGALSKAGKDVSFITEANRKASEGYNKALGETGEKGDKVAKTFSDKLTESLGGVNKEIGMSIGKFAKLNTVFNETKTNLESPITTTMETVQVLSAINGISGEYDSLRTYIENNPIEIKIVKEYVEA